MDHIQSHYAKLLEQLVIIFVLASKDNESVLIHDSFFLYDKDYQLYH